MREGKCGPWFGSSSLSLFTTRECCRRKAAFNRAINATKLRRLITPVSISPCFPSSSKGEGMQDGSVTVERRKRGPDVWCFKWREAGPDGRRIHRRIVLGTADELRSIASARKMVVGLRCEININDVRIRRESIKLADLSRHFQQRELVRGNTRIAYSTPFLAQEIMRHHIRPVARKLAITKRIGWHTFRHTYSTLLRTTGAELKIMQELLRHSTIRVTLDTYTQAVTTEKRNAQDAVVALLCPQKMQ